jgi:5'-3' exonuclease
MKELVFVDLSSIAHPIFHMSASEPDPNHCSQAIVARVHTLANGNEHVAICCDSGRSFRKELDVTYKANRPDRDATLHHQIALAIEALKADGFPIWTADGFEADDVIAAATTKALALDETTVLVVTGDKDLLQLVGPRVRAKSVQDGTIRDSGAVFKKFGVTPEQMRDYLTMVGDSSDNVKGIPGVGPKTAAGLLAKHDSLDKLYEDMQSVGAAALDLTPALATKLRAFKPDLAKTRALIALRTDVEIPFEQVLQPRVSEAAKVFEADVEAEPERPAVSDNSEKQPGPVAQPEPTNGKPTADSAMVVREPEVLAPAPSEWERQLDPRSLTEAKRLAVDMHQSRMFSAYGSPQAVLSTVMVGRELGLPAMASLRSIHNIEGKHGLAASLMVAVVLKSGMAEYFEPISFSDTEATFETLRKGARKPVRMTHTIEMAVQAWPKTKTDWQDRFTASGWGRNPTDMLVARATSRLARMVYPDLLASLYTPDELAEMREVNRAA